MKKILAVLISVLVIINFSIYADENPDFSSEKNSQEPIQQDTLNETFTEEIINTDNQEDLIDDIKDSAIEPEIEETSEETEEAEASNVQTVSDNLIIDLHIPSSEKFAENPIQNIGTVRLNNFELNDEKIATIKISCDFLVKNGNHVIPFELSLDQDNWQTILNNEIIIKSDGTNDIEKELFLRFNSLPEVSGDFNASISFIIDTVENETPTEFKIGEYTLGKKASNILWKVIDDNKSITCSGYKQCTRFTNWMVEMIWGVPDNTKDICGHGKNKATELKNLYKDDVILVEGNLDDVSKVFNENPKNFVFSYESGEFGHTGIIVNYLHDESLEGNGFVIISHGNINEGEISLNRILTWDEWTNNHPSKMKFAININPHPNETLIQLWEDVLDGKIKIEVDDEIEVVEMPQDITENSDDIQTPSEDSNIIIDFEEEEIKEEVVPTECEEPVVIDNTEENVDDTKEIEIEAETEPKQEEAVVQDETPEETIVEETESDEKEEPASKTDDPAIPQSQENLEVQEETPEEIQPDDASKQEETPQTIQEPEPQETIEPQDIVSEPAVSDPEPIQVEEIK